MRPWFDVLHVDENAPWALIEKAYLAQWSVLKGKAFPTEGEKALLEELEQAFREAKMARHEKPSSLTDASLPDGTKPRPKPKPKPAEPILPPQEVEKRSQPRYQIEVEQPAVAPKPKKTEGGLGDIPGCGLAILFIVGVGVLLTVLIGLGVEPGVAGVLIVFVLPVVLFLVDYLRKQK